MPGLTLKQERFTLAYMETGNASEAYRQAYNAENMKMETIHVKACELLANGKVSARVAELKQAMATKHQVTVDSLVAELDEARMLALELKMPGAVTQSVMGKAKITGHVTDKARLEVEDNRDNTSAITAVQELLSESKATH